MHSIDVLVDEQYRGEIVSDELRETAVATLVHQRVDRACDLAIVVTGDAALHELNLRHRGIDATTDVLAFPNDPRGPFVEAPGQARYLGDVIISYPRALAQAAEQGHNPIAELRLLVAHGVLHLLGHDDQHNAKRKRMWAAQADILRAMGVEVNLPC